MNLTELQGRKIETLYNDERLFIRDSYLSYFDTCKPRKRAIGYCVVLGGVPSSRIGMLDAHFSRIPTNDNVGYSINIGPFPLFDSDPKLKAVLEAYMQTDKRLKPFTEGKFTLDNSGQGPIMPLFVPTMNSNNERMPDCKLLMLSAGKAIGFNASKLRLNELGGAMFIPMSMHYDSETGWDFANNVKIGEFFSKITKFSKST